MRSGIWTEIGEQAFWVELGFPLHSKSNFRRGGTGSATQWRAEQAFRAQVAAVVGAALPAGWEPGTLSVPVAQRPVIAVTIVACSRLDTANLAKSLLDALEGLVFANDAQVRAQCSISERTGEGRGLVAVARFAPGTELSALSAGAARLSAAAVEAFTTLA